MRHVLFTIGAVWALIIVSNGRIDPVTAMLIPCGLIGLSAGLWYSEKRIS